jgi:hypothetical protein
MRKTILSVLAAVAAFSLAGAAPASAAETANQVVVFGHELSALRVYEDAQGCQQLPIDAHQLNNRTDRVVTLYADPMCAIPQMVSVQPDYGTQIPPGTGSFALS